MYLFKRPPRARFRFRNVRRARRDIEDCHSSIRTHQAQLRFSSHRFPASKTSPSGRGERRVAIRDEQEGIGLHAERPATNTHNKHDKLEQPFQITPGKQNSEPRDDSGRDGEDDQHEVVRNREESFHERQPAVQILLDVRIVDLQVH